jgi:hypothetical protein
VSDGVAIEPIDIAKSLARSERERVGRGYFIGVNHRDPFREFDILEVLEALELATREQGVSVQGVHVVPTDLGKQVREIVDQENASRLQPVTNTPPSGERP